MIARAFPSEERHRRSKCRSGARKERGRRQAGTPERLVEGRHGRSLQAVDARESLAHDALAVDDGLVAVLVHR